VSRLNEVLWQRYREQGDLQARTQLLDSYLGLVHHTAHEMRRNRAGNVELDDLVGAGTVGLVQALEGFEPERGLAFSTYAMPRIRGAMLDEIQSRDWSPRTVRVRRRLLAEARAHLQQALGAVPSEAQVAERMGVDMPTYHKWVGEVEGRSIVALDHAPRGLEDEPLHEMIPDERVPEPGAELMQEQQLDQLREGLQSLPSKDRMVLALYYFENLTLREIGEVLHVSESRVSQIHGRALKRLRAEVEA
jgi:RNA polymerase sigma factor for flagellar operon FliA